MINEIQEWFTKVWHYPHLTLFIRSLPQEEFIRGALAQLEAERDEARRQLEEEHRLHMAARHQTAVALSLEHQHHSHKPVHDQHDHTQNQHSHCEHSHEHSGEEDEMVIALFYVSTLKCPVCPIYSQT